jgi:hypothetical protein
MTDLTAKRAAGTNCEAKNRDWSPCLRTANRTVAGAGANGRARRLCGQHANAAERALASQAAWKAAQA